MSSLDSRSVSPLSLSGLRTSLHRPSPKRGSAQLPACLHAAASDCLRSYAPARMRPCTASLHFAGCSRTSRLLPAVTHAVSPSWSEVGSLGESMQRPWPRHKSELVPSIHNNRSISVWLMQIHGICRVFREYLNPNPKYRVPDLSGITFSELISNLSFENSNF